MKRKENESFEAYKKRRIQARMLQETMLAGTIHKDQILGGVVQFATVAFNKAKYQRMLRKLDKANRGIQA